MKLGWAYDTPLSLCIIAQNSILAKAVRYFTVVFSSPSLDRITNKKYWICLDEASSPVKAPIPKLRFAPSLHLLQVKSNTVYWLCEPPYNTFILDVPNPNMFQVLVPAPQAQKCFRETFPQRPPIRLVIGTVQLPPFPYLIGASRLPDVTPHHRFGFPTTELQNFVDCRTYQRLQREPPTRNECIVKVSRKVGDPVQ